MREVVFIADDFGRSIEGNEAIVHAHEHGRLHGAALMMGQPATEHAVSLARRYPALQVGLHLHLVDSRPCTVPAWPWGDSPARAGFALGFLPRMRALARREIRTQWQSFRSTGLTCRFVNAHHHLHVHPFVRQVLGEILPADFSGWVRWGRPRFFSTYTGRMGYEALYLLLQAPARRRWPCHVSTTLWGVDRTFAMSADEIRHVLPTLGPGLHEFMFHPRSRRGDRDTDCLVALRPGVGRD